jgi:hypothetical protein
MTALMRIGIAVLGCEVLFGVLACVAARYGDVRLALVGLSLVLLCFLSLPILAFFDLRK